MEIETLSKDDRAVAIGEIGLDFYYDFSPRDVQRAAFERQLALARDLDLPVIIHSRDAHQETFELVRKYRPRGIVHCFSGSAELAREYAKLGMYLGLPGSSRSNAKSRCRGVRNPAERLLLETDCPYMAPVPFRGKRCDSTMLPHTAAAIAAARGMETDALVRAAWENAARVYEIAALPQNP